MSTVYGRGKWTIRFDIDPSWRHINLGKLGHGAKYAAVRSGQQGLTALSVCVEHPVPGREQRVWVVSAR